MNIREARIVASILQEADRGCSYCVGQLVELANNLLPGFEWEVDEDTKVKVKEKCPY